MSTNPAIITANLIAPDAVDSENVARWAQYAADPHPEPMILAALCGEFGRLMPMWWALDLAREVQS